MNKKIILIFIILISIILIVGSFYLKMKNDKQKEKEQQYYDEQKERITLYMKYNVKKYKDVTFTNVEENPLDGYDISGYVNHNKKAHFTAHLRSNENYQFQDVLSYSEDFENILSKNTKSVSEIKKEEKNKQNEN
ncbi:DUF1433 domain-containing protein [Staphylococcus epidermidis]|uniref:DUF1433 domain-containing protein n=2 Tax=Staphylococcus epidermidis TaxID=1282 RepID=UPI001F313D25|nr:DUF1433 domain-containing protein [Staphylococcus epidermidis]MCE5030312.1 DUF1433 domain-containing protein [Staphylococcus epidermidis]MCE5032597.1 DUF1433 domain-containing protein [Staphylococcus epidermidis]